MPTRNPKPRVNVKTFGCKVNLCDSRRLAGRLARAGCAIVTGADEGADAYLVNTCAVTDRAVKKCAKFLRGLNRDHPGSPVAVFGCAPSLGDGLPRIEGQSTFPRGEEERAVDFLLESLGMQSSPAVQDCRSENRESRAGDEAPDAASPISPSQSTDLVPGAKLGKTRAFLKIADGCDGTCTYCIVPKLRGHLYSRPEEEILAEASGFADGGHREIVLTAIHLGGFGKDLDPAISLGRLVRRLLDIRGVARVRLSSIEAMELNDELLSLADEPRFAPHFHLPLQSGDAQVLRRMDRRYSPEDYLHAIEAVRERFGIVGLSTDVIVGFPSETDEAFQNTLDVVRRAHFTRIHAFPFSPRKGTPAWGYSDRPTPVEVRGRMKILMDEGRRLAREFRESKVGRDALVLAEKESEDREGWLEGLDGTYQRVVFRAGDSELGILSKVRITGVEGEYCVGEKV